MAIDHFLVNPARYGARGRRRTLRRKRKGGLPSPLLKRMMRQYGRGRGMREAWRAYRGGVRKNTWPGQRQAHKRAAGIGWSSRRTRIKGYSKPAGGHYPRWNPLGEEVMIVGANPRRRRRSIRRRRFRANVANPRRRRRYARRRRNLALNPRRRYYRRRRRSYRRNYAMNPRRRYRRRYRRNPARAASLPAISFRNPMSILMPAAFGTAGYVAAERIPVMIGMAASPLPRFGIKAAVTFAGPMILGRFLGRTSGIFFAVGSGISLLTDILKTYVFKTGQLGAFPYQEYGAIPEYFQGNGGYGTPYEETYPTY